MGSVKRPGPRPDENAVSSGTLQASTIGKGKGEKKCAEGRGGASRTKHRSKFSSYDAEDFIASICLAAQAQGVREIGPA